MNETPFPRAAVISFKFNLLESSGYGSEFPVFLSTIKASFLDTKKTSSDMIPIPY